MLSLLGMESCEIPYQEKQSQVGIALVLWICIRVEQISKSPLPVM